MKEFRSGYLILEEFVEMLTKHDRCFLKPVPDYQVKAEWQGRPMVEVAAEVLALARQVTDTP